ncbi:MAG: GIY-YIG nuclease family protein [Elusimicrobiota bacterium]
MLDGLKDKPGAKKEYSVYILTCAGGTLYTGIAKDVRARLKQHRAGKGAAYTRTHLPVRLVYQEDGFTRSEALVREARIKAFPVQKKRALLAADSAS